ncbi:Phosphoenolpyruvate carboxykinase [ATP] [Carex littledalei]|uniref:Phosphoenolpyruvate carboxykinase [ATP] n=1 Tax=Carex littledalei TaxID=544730 RepID=A0A833VIC7_9POAL|nr:Phosphoenolpyruvate carboxykinase [ATP] [Carex littledalei]
MMSPLRGFGKSEVQTCRRVLIAEVYRGQGADFTTVFVNDQFLNRDPENKIKVHIISAQAYHSLFMHNIAIKCGLIYYSALYHLHLVKAETAQAFIPKEFRLVEAFGY